MCISLLIGIYVTKEKSYPKSLLCNSSISSVISIIIIIVTVIRHADPKVYPLTIPSLSPKSRSIRFPDNASRI